MRIKKKSCNACDESLVNNSVVDTTQPVEGTEETFCPYAASSDYIRKAIDTLAEFAGDEDCAQEAIANLSVILMDLQK